MLTHRAALKTGFAFCRQAESSQTANQPQQQTPEYKARVWRGTLALKDIPRRPTREPAKGLKWDSFVPAFSQLQSFPPAFLFLG